MGDRITAEDFAQANLATKGEFGVARRTDPIREHQWHVYGGGYGWFSDEEMAAGGWVPVVESRVTEHTLRGSQEKAARKREKLVDHIADQDRVIRRRNDEIAVLRLELADAQAPLSLESLAAAYEAAEQADECRKGDVLISKSWKGGDNFRVYSARSAKDLPPGLRILSRAPKREPWQDLADVLGDFAIHDTDGKEYPDVLARKLYERGVRATGGEA